MGDMRDSTTRKARPRPNLLPQVRRLRVAVTMRRMRRFLLIGLDGLEPTLATRWMDEGRLPHLAALARRGAFMPCASTVPHATFPAWATCVTGVNPGRHGVFDFTRMRPGSYGIAFTNATQRRAPALWNVLSDAGARVGVLGVPGTFPPEPVNGFMVSGFDSPVSTAVSRAFVYPEALYPRVKDWRFADFQETRIGPGWHARALSKLLDGVAVKECIACDLIRTESPDFFMLVFGESDTVSHHFWLFHDPQSPRHRPGFETAIQQVYERLDQAVGRLIEAFGDAVVGVVSDHGFGGAGTGVVHLNNWLAGRGHLAFSGDSDTGSALMKRVALAAVPGSWQGALFRKLSGAAARAESGARFGGIDWPRTRAFSEELNYFPSVRVNLKGREPQGTVDPADYDAFVADLCAEIEAWDCVAKAHPRGTIYDGPYVERAPDIVLDLALEQGYSHSCLRARGGPAFRRIGPNEHLGGKERGMNGNHRPDGVLMLSEPIAAGDASLLDVAPTVLAAMGVPAPSMEGRSLLGGAVEGEAPASALRPEAEYTPGEERELEDRLRALGYLE